MGAMAGDSGPFGQRDPNATMQDPNNPNGKFIHDPSQGLSGGQLAVRKGLAGSLSGVGKGLQQQGQPQPNQQYQFQQPAPFQMQPLDTSIPGLKRRPFDPNSQAGGFWGGGGYQ